MIEVENLTKVYGPNRGINNVSFKVNEGTIVGLLGPNGAGKTTTMKILTCAMPPSSGTAFVAGYDITKQSKKVKANLGYLPETPPVYLDMVVEDYLTYTAKLHQVPHSQIEERVNHAIDQCSLESVKHRLVGNLSKGYKQRVGLAQAILHDPKVIILDEPTVGLDPNQILEIRSLIKNLAGKHTIILCTHILQEVQAVCDHVIIINNGQVVADDTLESLNKGLGDTLKVRMEVSALDASGMKSVSGVKSVEEVVDLKNGNKLIKLSVGRGDEVRSNLSQYVFSKNAKLYEMRVESKSLEDLFVELTTKF